MPEYDNLKIPLQFRERFEKLNKLYALGYSSYPEFAKDAMRRRFEDIEAFYQKKTET